MMGKRSKKELITGVRDFLRDFEEPYDHREWERFQRHRKKKQRKPLPLFVKLAGIAASLFLMVYASVKYLPLLDGTDRKETPVPRQTPKLPADINGQREDSITIDSISQGVDRSGQTNEEDGIQPGEIRRMVDSPGDIQSQQVSSELPGGRETLMSDAKMIMPPTGSEMETVPLPKHLGSAGKLPKRTPHRGKGISLPSLHRSDESGVDLGNIGFGVNLNPAFTDKGFTFGGGVSARIPLTDRISTEIGINYSRMTAGKNWRADMTDTINSQTVGTRNTVGMVSIPFSLNYAFSENFSASLGLMPFRAVSDRRTDILQTNRWVRGDLSSGDTTRRLVSERSKMRQPDSLYLGNNYWGFVQLSGRISPTFLKRYNIVIAPYVGIPIGRLRNEQYQWLHGGVSLRFYLPQTNGHGK
ncbi:hypothetical protein JHJ32_07565 [Parapedobacter sp. ISTM3]|uniref:hypothetical protein n=1 Tax=Parapedobacter sp. ISTM3 TaxID=2800130 RepID=UPI0019078BF6|nr:hypothetical protein [Parapedobacter sp. ISTM3]MBK1439836.1 hypothetical protein [Parapedobacter sp. ISTM3]